MADVFHRRVIRITGDDSPNVRLAKAQLARGERPTHEILVPGVLPYADYAKRMATWDKVRICIGIHGQFYEGAEVLLYPPEWLNKSEERADIIERTVSKRQAKGIGIDPAEGGDRTAMSVVDELGLIEQVSRRTPDTAVIGNEVIAFMRKHSVPPERVVFDRGGGGRQIADALRASGYPVRSVGFGEGVSAPITRLKVRPLLKRIEDVEDRYAFKNRRAQMYGELRLLLDPSLTVAASVERGQEEQLKREGLNEHIFAIPREYAELRRQLAPIPLQYDPEGRLWLPPKNKRSPTSTEATLTELIGCSPDEADSLVLAVHAMLYDERRATASGF